MFTCSFVWWIYNYSFHCLGHSFWLCVFRKLCPYFGAFGYSLCDSLIWLKIWPTYNFSYGSVGLCVLQFLHERNHDCAHDYKGQCLTNKVLPNISWGSPIWCHRATSEWLNQQQKLVHILIPYIEFDGPWRISRLLSSSVQFCKFKKLFLRIFSTKLATSMAVWS